MNRRKSYLSAAVLALVMAGAAAPAIMDQYLQEKEGFALNAYQDGARIWTDCNGRAHHGGKPRSDATKAECQAWLKTEIGQRLQHVHSIIKVPMSEPAWAGVGSWCFNVGNAGCARSTTVKLLNRGDQVAGCKAILNWRYITRDGKKVDCSTVQPYCAGLWERRNGEAELCAL